MKRNTLSSLALAVIIVMMGACNNDLWDELPESIANFISEYFPYGELESYTDNDDGTAVVNIKHGATLTFDRDYEWIDVNGNGVVLPQQFLYDRLPEALYRYIESAEAQNSVYRVVRTRAMIVVTLLDSSIDYDQSTGRITQTKALS